MKSMRKLLDLNINEMSVSPVDFSDEEYLKKMQTKLQQQQYEFAIDYAKQVEDYFDEKLKIRDVEISTIGSVNTISITYKKNVRDKNQRPILENFKKQISSYITDSYSKAGWVDPRIQIWWEEMFKISNIGIRPGYEHSKREPTMIVIKISMQQPAPAVTKSIDLDIAA